MLSLSSNVLVLSLSSTGVSVCTIDHHMQPNRLDQHRYSTSRSTPYRASTHMHGASHAHLSMPSSTTTQHNITTHLRTTTSSTAHTPALCARAHSRTWCCPGNCPWTWLWAVSMSPVGLCICVPDQGPPAPKPPAQPALFGSGGQCTE